MTETEWLRCSEPKMMLEFLGTGTSERKLRLFSVACCRRVWNCIDGEPYRRAVEIAASYADGNATAEELADAFIAAKQYYFVQTAGRHNAGAAAVSAAFPPQDDKPREARHTHRLFAAIRAASHAQDLGTGEHDENERTAQAALVRDIFGNPFRPSVVDPAWLAWNNSAVIKIAQSVYGGSDLAGMAVLSEALKAADCDDSNILDHCRQPGPHVRGCWVVDSILGKG